MVGQNFDGDLQVLSGLVDAYRQLEKGGGKEYGLAGGGDRPPWEEAAEKRSNLRQQLSQQISDHLSGMAEAINAGGGYAQAWKKFSHILEPSEGPSMVSAEGSELAGKLTFAERLADQKLPAAPAEATEEDASASRGTRGSVRQDTQGSSAVAGSDPRWERVKPVEEQYKADGKFEIRSGNTLYDIANSLKGKHGFEGKSAREIQDAIVTLNKIKDPDVIRIGQVLGVDPNLLFGEEITPAFLASMPETPDAAQTQPTRYYAHHYDVTIGKGERVDPPTQYKDAKTGLIFDCKKKDENGYYYDGEIKAENAVNPTALKTPAEAPKTVVAGGAESAIKNIESNVKPKTRSDPYMFTITYVVDEKATDYRIFKSDVDLLKDALDVRVEKDGKTISFGVWKQSGGFRDVPARGAFEAQSATNLDWAPSMDAGKLRAMVLAAGGADMVKFDNALKTNDTQGLHAMLLGAVRALSPPPQTKQWTPEERQKLMP